MYQEAARTLSVADAAVDLIEFSPDGLASPTTETASLRIRIAQCRMDLARQVRRADLSGRNETEG